ncbi:hypothetical protein MLD38_028425 [Melastoma candidum]|uniref:Uncharacterized protein n=1 Tax=Melastoma candidum TaxID=119954 RepID=A0ACB9N0Z4_9MYRT|nr:hypothetical protein MLD38_028425 [Melastoma candidum]
MAASSRAPPVIPQSCSCRMDKSPIANLKTLNFPIPGINRRNFLLSLLAFPAGELFLVDASSCSALAADGLVTASSSEASRRIEEAIRLLELGREFQAKGDFDKALMYFTLVIEGYKDFALSEYARVGRALALYEVGDRDEAITEMEDVSVSLKGYPEVHAALAAALYADKHAPLLAENQFTIATLLDPHYTDVSYVKDTKHWPPSLVSSLQQFITLT